MNSATVRYHHAFFVIITLLDNHIIVFKSIGFDIFIKIRVIPHAIEMHFSKFMLAIYT